MTSPGALLNAIEPLSAVDRARHLDTLAWELMAPDPADLDVLVTGLLDTPGGPRYYETRVALRLARTGKRTASLLRLVTSPSPDIAGSAAHALARGAVDATTIAAMVGLVPDLPADTLDAVVRGAVQAPAPDLADALLPVLRETRGDRIAGKLLAACSTAVVTMHIDNLWPMLTRRARLARRHPEVALAALRRHLSEQGMGRYWLGVSATIDGLLASDPDRYTQAVLDLVEAHVLDLVEAHHPYRSQSGFGSRQSIGLLAARAPRRTATIIARLLTSWSTSGLVAGMLTRRNLRRFLAVTDLTVRAPHDAARTQPLINIARLSGYETLTRLLAVVPPRDRGTLLDAVLHGYDTADLPADVGQAELLPRERRHNEARRMLARATEHNDARAQVIALSLLPLAEAENDLRAATVDADPDQRASAYVLLITCARRTGEPGEVHRVLASLTRLRNEGQRVRLSVLWAIGRIPVGLFTDACAPVLDTIFRDALEEHDRSDDCAREISALCAKILVGGQDGPPRQDSPLTTTALAGIYRNLGAYGLPDLSRTAAAARECVVEMLLPLIDEEAHKKSFSVLFTLVRALGGHAHEHAPLTERVGRLFLQQAFTTHQAHTDAAISLLLAEPATRDEWVRRIVATYPGAVLHPSIWPLASTRLTDLLTPEILAGEETAYPAPAGAWVTLDLRGAPRWTPAQIDALSAHLDTVLRSTAHDHCAALWAITALAALPDTAHTGLVSLPRREQVVDAERGLQALARCDRPEQAHTELLAHLRGDHARVAADAVVRTARRLPPSTALAAWTEALAPAAPPVPVVARKALIIAVPALHVPVRTIPALLGDNPHGDIVTAAVSAALQCIPDQDAWALLDALLPTSPMGGHAIASIAPSTLRLPDRPRFAALVARLCATTGTGEDEIALRTAALRTAARWAEHDPAVGHTLYHHITHLPTDDQTWRTACAAALALVRDGWTTGWAEAVTRLIDLDRADHHHASARRANQRLTAVTATGDRWRRPQDAPRHVADVVRLLGDARTPTGRPTHLALACALLANAVPLYTTPYGQADPGGARAALAQLCALVEGRTALAVHVGEILAARLASYKSAPPPMLDDVYVLDDLDIAVARLLPSASPAGQVVLLGLIEGCGARTGWTPPWRAHLAVLQAATDAEVVRRASGVELEQM